MEPARNNYPSAPKKLGEIWLDGEKSATSPPIAPSRTAPGQSRRYDLQMNVPMTFRTDDGRRAGLSFIQPRERGRVCARTDDEGVGFGCGFLGRPRLS